ncbi:hypothetical protein HIM_02086 [Hirsutella minnesotensis 3608]|nr:hypothetical protein HIM_02086 [Hirsutella minnesotensis 3608]
MLAFMNAIGLVAKLRKLKNSEDPKPVVYDLNYYLISFFILLLRASFAIFPGAFITRTEEERMKGKFGTVVVPVKKRNMLIIASSIYGVAVLGLIGMSHHIVRRGKIRMFLFEVAFPAATSCAVGLITTEIIGNEYIEQGIRGKVFWAVKLVQILGIVFGLIVAGVMALIKWPECR